MNIIKPKRLTTNFGHYLIVNAILKHITRRMLTRINGSMHLLVQYSLKNE